MTTSAQRTAAVEVAAAAALQLALAGLLAWATQHGTDSETRALVPAQRRPVG
jgi:hypothetical protein